MNPSIMRTVQGSGRAPQVLGAQPREQSLRVQPALVVENERCYLRAALPLDERTAAALDRAMDFIARESLKLKRQFSPSAEVPEILGMFAE